MNESSENSTKKQNNPTPEPIIALSSEAPLVFKDEKEHYKSLISLFKFSLGIVGAVASIIAVISYKDRGEIRAQMKETIDDMKARMLDAEKDMERKFSNIHSETMLLNSRTQSEILSIKSDAKNEISSIQSLAMVEARKAINQVFSEKKFDQFVEQVAKDRMEPQIISLVDNRIDLDRKKEMKKIDSAINSLASGNTKEAAIAHSFLTVNLSKITEAQTNRLIEVAKQINFNNDVNSSANQYLLTLLFLINSNSVYDFAKEIVLSNFKKEKLNDVLYDSAFAYIINTTKVENFDFYKKLILESRGGGMYRTILSAIANLPDQTNIDVLLKLLNFNEGVDYVIKQNSMIDVIGLRNDLVQFLQFKVQQKDLDKTYYFQRSK